MVDPCSSTLTSALDKLRPSFLQAYEWAGLSSLPRFFGTITFILFVLVIDCNNFFLKFVLWVPAEHDLLKYRVAFWGLWSLATSKEWYEYISNPYCHRLGPFAWLTLYTCGVETMTVIKCSEGQFTEPFPWYVKVIWAVIAVLFLWFMSIAYGNQRRQEEQRKSSDKDFNPYNPDLDIVVHASKKTQ